MSHRGDRRGDRSRSPHRNPPVIQENKHTIVNNKVTCGLCHDNELSVEHGHDWDLWMMIGPDLDTVTHAARYLDMYLVWQSIYYSSAGASIPICYDCRLSTHRSMQRIANLEIQQDCREYSPQLNELGHAKYEIFIAYKTIAKQIASQLHDKMKRIEEKRMANSRSSRGSENHW
jgi:hypothetical protein